jgi:protein-tyrosine-phosphatase
MTKQEQRKEIESAIFDYARKAGFEVDTGEGRSINVYLDNTSDNVVEICRSKFTTAIWNWASDKTKEVEKELQDIIQDAREIIEMIERAESNRDNSEYSERQYREACMAHAERFSYD